MFLPNIKHNTCTLYIGSEFCPLICNTPYHKVELTEVYNVTGAYSLSFVFLIYLQFILLTVSNDISTTDIDTAEGGNLFANYAFGTKALLDSRLEIKKIFRSPFGDQPENYSCQMQFWR